MTLRLSLLFCGGLVVAAPVAAAPPAAGVPIPGIPTRDVLLGTLDPGRDMLRESSLKPLEIDVQCALDSLRQSGAPRRIETADRPEPRTPPQTPGQDSGRRNLEGSACPPAEGKSDQAAPKPIP